MSKLFFAEVSDALVGFLPPSLRGFSSRLSGRNLKVWYGSDRAVHYEVQVVRVGRRQALEVGLHAEHASAVRNDEVLASLGTARRAWRRALGPQAEAGAFLGRQREWRRLSEVWKGHEESPEAAVEAAERLARYIRTLEPLRGGSKRKGITLPGAEEPGNP